MKIKLIFLWVLLPLPLFAANPSFNDFNVNQFGVPGNKVSLKSGVTLTNANSQGTFTHGIPATGNYTTLDTNGNFTHFGTNQEFDVQDNNGNTFFQALGSNATVNIPSPGVFNVGGSANITGAVFQSSITITNPSAANTSGKLTYIGRISMVVDGGGSVIPTTKVIPTVIVPYAGTVVKATLLSDVASLTGIDIWKTNYSQYPPLVANSIVAAAPPQLASTLTSQDSTLSSWVKGFVSNDVFKFTVLSNSAATFLRLDLDVIKQ